VAADTTVAAGVASAAQPGDPAVIGPDQIVRSGADGLRYLADLATPHRDRRLLAGLTGQRDRPLPHRSLNFYYYS
jgi:hypothetical protein